MTLFPGIVCQQAVAAAGPQAPTVVSITPTTVASGTSHDISLGSTVTAGDLLIIWAAADGGNSDLPATTAQNWTRIASYGSTGGSGLGAGVGVFKKLADGTEGGTTINITTPSTEQLSCQCFRIQTWSGNIADVAVGTVQHTNSGTNVTVPGLTSGWGAVPTLWIPGVSMSNSVTFVSGPADYTITETGTPGGSDGQIRTGWRQLTAASVGDLTFVFTSGTIYASANMIAVKGTS